MMEKEESFQTKYVSIMYDHSLDSSHDNMKKGVIFGAKLSGYISIFLFFFFFFFFFT